jgi:hypothetical protein
MHQDGTLAELLDKKGVVVPATEEKSAEAETK